MQIIVDPESFGHLAGYAIFGTDEGEHPCVIQPPERSGEEDEGLARATYELAQRLAGETFSVVYGGFAYLVELSPVVPGFGVILRATRLGPAAQPEA
jgi:hypothetical protein